MTFISISLLGGIGAIPTQMRSSIDYAIYLEPSRAPYLQLALAQAQAIERISFIFPMFFIAVTVLVVFMTITRMIEQDRGQIATLKTLGYRQDQIVAKYIYFTLVASSVGAFLGLLGGAFGVAPLIFNSVMEFHDLPAVSGSVPFIGLGVVFLMIGFSISAAGFTAFHIARRRPAQLLTAKAPRIGGKILLERIPFLWKPLPFRYKSGLRNIFRYRVRFFMTVLSVTFSTALVFWGIALSFTIAQTDPHMVDTIRPISIIIVIAAILLNAMVIYNITNINIDERHREIATLRVLGYRNVEVVGYVYREIFILTLIGVIFGLPTGFYSVGVLFDFIEFGNRDYVNWYNWVITGGLSLLSLALADLLLFKKIHNVDMNTSLKAVE